MIIPRPSTLHGYAFHVRHPRRKDQDYVTASEAYVVADIVQTVRDCGWNVEVTLIAYRGEGALPCTYCIGDLHQALVDAGYLAWVKREGQSLVGLPVR